MATQKKLGVYWGDFGIYFAEVVKDALMLEASVPFSAVLDGGDTNVQSVSEDARLLELIQKTIRNQGFTTVDAHLSVPSRDVIVRWFAIPFMKAHEIQGVVAFEARKYIPFPLEELDYTYYPATFTRESTKQIGIVFVGVRREVLRRYITVLSQSGLNVIYTEPSCMSFLRTLVSRKAVDITKITAILKIDRDRAEIDIASNGFVKFVRDFNISSGKTPGIEDSEDFLRSKCYNESRISLDFFNRQHSEDVVQVFALTASPDKTIASGLTEDLGLPVLSADARALLNASHDIELGIVGAFGVALSGQVPVVIDFNLSEGDAAAGVQVKVREHKTTKLPSSVFPFVSGFISLLLIAGAWLMTGQQIGSKEKSIAEVSARLGTFKDMQQEEIDVKRSKQRKVLNALKPLHLHSDLMPLAIRLFRLLPEGMWLTNVSFAYKEPTLDAGETAENVEEQSPPQGAEKGAPKAPKPKVTIDLSGYVFLEDANVQYDVVNTFLSVLRSDEMLSDYGTNFKLTTLKSQLEGNEGSIYITSFTIKSE